MNKVLFSKIISMTKNDVRKAESTENNSTGETTRGVLEKQLNLFIMLAKSLIFPIGKITET